jgi:hypothetical protein
MSVSKNLYVDQGSSFIELISVSDSQGQPLNLNNYTTTSQIRKNYTSQTSVYFDVSILNNTQIKLYLDAYATANLSSGKYVYDVLLSDDNGNVERIQEGTIIVSPGVTR